MCAPLMMMMMMMIKDVYVQSLQKVIVDVNFVQEKAAAAARCYCRPSRAGEVSTPISHH
jgi:hypothetical protein